jgi:Mg-chelatase subunit ChlD
MDDTHILPSWTCPITREVMIDPVMCSDGFSYERTAIEKWLRTSKLSPSTGLPLQHTMLVPNHALRNVIQEGLHQVNKNRQPTTTTTTSTTTTTQQQQQPQQQQPNLSLTIRALTNTNDKTPLVTTTTTTTTTTSPTTPTELIIMTTLKSMDTTTTTTTTTPQPTTTLPKKQKKGIDLVVALDRSGSMKEDNKLELCKRTMDFIVNEALSERDRFSIVAFDTDVVVPLKLTHMDEKGKQKARAAIKNIVTGSQTNISGALFRAITELADAGSTGNDDRTSAILLLTDGQANSGITDANKISNIMSSMMKQNYPPNKQTPSLFTFGFGNDADSQFLSTIAVPTGGLYYAITSTQAVPTAFADCIGGLLCVAAQQVELRIEIAPTNRTRYLVEIVDERLTGYQFQIESNRTTAQVIMKDIYAGESRDLLFKVKLTPTIVLPTSNTIGNNNSPTLDLIKKWLPSTSPTTSTTTTTTSTANNNKKLSWSASWRAAMGYHQAAGNNNNNSSDSGGDDDDSSSSSPTTINNNNNSDVQVFVAVRYVDCELEKIITQSQLAHFNVSTSQDPLVARHLVRIRAATSMSQARKDAKLGHLDVARQLLKKEQAFLQKTLLLLNIKESDDAMLAEIAEDLRTGLTDLENQQRFETVGNGRLQSMSLSHSLQRSNIAFTNTFTSPPPTTTSNAGRATTTTSNRATFMSPKSSYSTPSKIALVSRSDEHFSSTT